ncbi:MAG: DinB family protein [Vicinamibacterales bacterium]
MREVERIARLLELTFEGRAYHGPSLRQALDGVDVGIAARRPEGGVHSIWELVGHVTSELRHARALLEGNAETWVAGRTTWPALETPSPTAWFQALRDLEDANREFVSAVGRIDDAVLDEQLFQVRRTYYVMLHGMVQHTAYHAGQIAVLKRQLKAADTDVRSAG